MQPLKDFVYYKGHIWLLILTKI